MTLRNFFPLLGLRFFVTHYFLKPCSNTHSKLRFHTYYSHFKQMPGIVATYKQKQICLYNKGIIPNSISAYHHPSCEECREGRRGVDVNHTSLLKAFIYLSDSGSGSGSGSGCGFRIPDPNFLVFHTPIILVIK